MFSSYVLRYYLHLQHNLTGCRIFSLLFGCFHHYHTCIIHATNQPTTRHHMVTWHHLITRSLGHMICCGECLPSTQLLPDWLIAAPASLLPLLNDWPVVCSCHLLPIGCCWCWCCPPTCLYSAALPNAIINDVIGLMWVIPRNAVSHYIGCCTVRPSPVPHNSSRSLFLALPSRPLELEELPRHSPAQCPRWVSPPWVHTTWLPTQPWGCTPVYLAPMPGLQGPIRQG